MVKDVSAQMCRRPRHLQYHVEFSHPIIPKKTCMQLLKFALLSPLKCDSWLVYYPLYSYLLLTVSIPSWLVSNIRASLIYNTNMSVVYTDTSKLYCSLSILSCCRATVRSLLCMKPLPRKNLHRVNRLTDIKGRLSLKI